MLLIGSSAFSKLREKCWSWERGWSTSSLYSLFSTSAAATIVFPSNFQEPRQRRLHDHYSGLSEETVWLNVLIRNLLHMSDSSGMDQKVSHRWKKKLPFKNCECSAVKYLQEYSTTNKWAVSWKVFQVSHLPYKKHMYELRCSVSTPCMDIVVATAYSASDYRYSSTSALLALSKWFWPSSLLPHLAGCHSGKL